MTRNYSRLSSLQSPKMYPFASWLTKPHQVSLRLSLTIKWMNQAGTSQKFGILGEPDSRIHLGTQKWGKRYTCSHEVTNQAHEAEGDPVIKAEENRACTCFRASRTRTDASWLHISSDTKGKLPGDLWGRIIHSSRMNFSKHILTHLWKRRFVFLETPTFQRRTRFLVCGKINSQAGQHNMKK